MDASALSSAAGALERSIKALESRSDSLENWLKFWIALVVVGVVVEFFIEIKEYFRERDEYRRGTIHSPEKPSKVKLFFNLLGAGLVAIGVAGEFGVGIKSGSVDSELRNKNRELVGLFQGAASEAMVSASANEIEAIRLKLELANVDLRTEELKTRMGGRRITPRQHREFSALLRQYRPIGAVVLTKLADGEAAILANDFQLLFFEVHWSVAVVLRNADALPASYGVFCTVDDRTAAGKALIEVLKKVPTTHVRIVSGSLTDGNIAYIDVGLSPR